LKQEVLAHIDAMNHERSRSRSTHGSRQDPTSLSPPKRNWKLIPCPWGLGGGGGCAGGGVPLGAGPCCPDVGRCLSGVNIIIIGHCAARAARAAALRGAACGGISESVLPPAKYIYFYYSYVFRHRRNTILYSVLGLPRNIYIRQVHIHTVF